MSFALGVRHLQKRAEARIGVWRFFFCLMAARRGHGIEETANKLLEVSSKAQERARLHDEGYALITAQNAAAAAERGRKRGRG
jgi:hypothetical protein